MRRFPILFGAAVALIPIAALVAGLAPQADGGETGTPAPAAAGRVITADAPIHVLQGGLLEVQVLLDQASVGTTDAAMSLLVAHPGAGAPEHTHEGAELLYVLEGRAEMTFGGEPASAGPGDAVHIPAGVRHTFSVPADSPPLRAVQVYVPGGPEQRFKVWPVKGDIDPTDQTRPRDAR